jgi:uncharacterized protein
VPDDGGIGGQHQDPVAQTNMSGQPIRPEEVASADPLRAVSMTRVRKSRRLDERDRATVEAQLGRPPRAIRAVAHRCPCGLPDVVETSPRLTDGTPFPTLYYLACPRACAAVGRLEASGVMREMADRLAADASLASDYREAHLDYLARREAIEFVGEIAEISAGGMPGRVKCLHALAAHALAAGPGVNPLGDETLAMLPEWWLDGPCVNAPDQEQAEPAVGQESSDPAPARGGEAR